MKIISSHSDIMKCKLIHLQVRKLKKTWRKSLAIKIWRIKEWNWSLILKTAPLLLLTTSENFFYSHLLSIKSQQPVYISQIHNIKPIVIQPITQCNTLSQRHSIHGSSFTVMVLRASINSLMYQICWSETETVRWIYSLTTDVNICFD